MKTTLKIDIYNSQGYTVHVKTGALVNDINVLGQIYWQSVAKTHPHNLDWLIT